MQNERQRLSVRSIASKFLSAKDTEKSLEYFVNYLSVAIIDQCTASICQLRRTLFSEQPVSVLQNRSAMSFLKDLMPVLILFIIGDTLTTIYALQTGQFYEGNPALSYLFNTYGYNSLIPLKLSFLFLLYHVYRSADRPYWNFTRYSVSGIGLLATTSNIVVIFGMA